MNAPDWPTAAEVRQWHIDRSNKPMTPEQLEQMREAYERDAIADAQSAEDYAANVRSYSK